MKVSNSAIQCFKQCRRMYELKYVYGIEPVETAQALSQGLQYHDLVDGLLKGQSNFKDCDDPKIKAMATAFQMYVMPMLHDVIASEEWFQYETKSGHIIFGRIDAKTSDGEVVEHKTTSLNVDGAYFFKLEFDEQIMTYLTASGANTILYTVCKKPTIRQKKGESDEEYYLRCVDWYYEETDSKIACVKIYRTDEQLEKFKTEQDDIVNEMSACENFYRNPSNCSKWGRMCEYAPVCMDYDPNKEYVQFKRRERYYEETGEAEI